MKRVRAEKVHALLMNHMRAEVRANKFAKYILDMDETRLGSVFKQVRLIALGGRNISVMT